MPIALLVWAPSPARVLPLWQVAMQYGGGNPPALQPLRWPDTPGGATLDFGLDCSAMLSGGDTVVSAIVVPGALTLMGQIVQAGVLTVVLNGFVTGTDYPVTVTVASAAGRSINRVIRVRGI